MASTAWDRAIKKLQKLIDVRAQLTVESLFRPTRMLAPHNVPRYLRDVSMRAEAVITD